MQALPCRSLHSALSCQGFVHNIDIKWYKMCSTAIFGLIWIGLLRPKGEHTAHHCTPEASEVREDRGSGAAPFEQNNLLGPGSWHDMHSYGHSSIHRLAMSAQTLQSWKLLPGRNSEFCTICFFGISYYKSICDYIWYYMYAFVCIYELLTTAM